jgi:hypothetical protein
MESSLHRPDKRRLGRLDGQDRERETDRCRRSCRESGIPEETAVWEEVSALLGLTPMPSQLEVKSMACHESTGTITAEVVVAADATPSVRQLAETERDLTSSHPIARRLRANTAAVSSNEKVVQISRIMVVPGTDDKPKQTEASRNSDIGEIGRSLERDQLLEEELLLRLKLESAKQSEDTKRAIELAEGNLLLRLKLDSLKVTLQQALRDEGARSNDAEVQIRLTPLMTSLGLLDVAAMTLYKHSKRKNHGKRSTFPDCRSGIGADTLT